MDDPTPRRSVHDDPAVLGVSHYYSSLVLSWNELLLLWRNVTTS